MLTSIHNPRVREAVRLRDAGARADAGKFLIDGIREINRALTAHWEVQQAFVCEELIQLHPASKPLFDQLREKKCELIPVSDRVWEKLAFGNRRDGILAVAALRRFPLSQLKLPSNPLLVVLERIEKPGNIGAILRSCDAAKVDAVLLADPLTDVLNPNAIRASAGTVFHVQIGVDNCGAIMSFLNEREICPWVTRVDAVKSVYELQPRGGIALVLGNEAGGVSSHWHAPHTLAVRLPMLGIADSLNVSVTAAVMLYEIQRQRGVVR